MLDFFVESGENQQVEFKSGLPGETDEHKKMVMKTVAAFANGEGGSLLFGITNEYEVIGVPGANIANEEDRISDLIDDWVSPRPAWRFEVYPVANKPGFVVLALHVAQGTEPPYATGTKNVPIQYYVRHASRSVPARPNELRSLARSRPPKPSPPIPSDLGRCARPGLHEGGTPVGRRETEGHVR
jgi:predicted HTH transcriptional regulator